MLITRFPTHSSRAEERSGRVGDIHKRNLVVREGGDLVALRIGEPDLGVEYVRAGSKAVLELPLFRLVEPALEDRGLAGGEDSLPVGFDLIHRNEDFLPDQLPPVCLCSRSKSVFACSRVAEEPIRLAF